MVDLPTTEIIEPFIAKETNIPKLALIDNCFPDLIETSTFI